jgi:hypothetical protein
MKWLLPDCEGQGEEFRRLLQGHTIDYSERAFAFVAPPVRPYITAWQFLSGALFHGRL